MVGIGSFFFSDLLFSFVLLPSSCLRDKDQVTGHATPHSAPFTSERDFFSRFWRSRPLVFCVYKPHRYISARAVIDLAGSL